MIWLKLSMVPGFGWYLAKKIQNILPIRDLFCLPLNELASLLPLKKEKIEIIRSVSDAQVNQELKLCRENNITIIDIESPYYPKLLKEISSPPLVLYVKGELGVLNKFSVGIVGSRNPTAYGLQNAYIFARELTMANFAVVSGLASGIDTAAHQGALALRGKTIAVLGSGLGKIYPKENRQISDKISGNGAIVSEFSFNSPPLAKHFPRRNRIIAGLSVGLLVVEAAIKSGSLITAKYALQENREIFAIPGNINNNLSVGTHQLIKQGAKLVENIDDILVELTLYYNVVEVKLPSSSYGELADEYQTVYDAVSCSVTEVDVVIKSTGLEVSLILTILTRLELDGYLNRIPGGYVKIRRPYERTNS